jgi:glycosyltransferase involved in cell wall biosynthesis
MLGKPVICTDCTAVEDYVEDGVNGILAKMGDADDLRTKMMNLSCQTELYDRLSAGAYDWAEQNVNPLVLQKKVDDLVTQLMS